MAAYILQNQHDQFLDKQGEWVYGCSAKELFRTTYKDVALNHLIELNSQDINLRGQVVACEQDSKGNPILPAKQSAA